MQFRNPENGYTESKSTPWLWCLLFGPLYLMFSGAFMHGAIIFFVAAVLYSSLGPSATLLVAIMNLLYCMFAGDIIKNAYLRKGWKVVGDPASEAATPIQPQAELTSHESPETKKCQFCAEEVKFEAIKCKHCGSDLREAASAA